VYQDLDDDIEVIALFERNKLKPCRFRWRGKVYKVTALPVIGPVMLANQSFGILPWLIPRQISFNSAMTNA